jgi:hypothetical protein
MLDGGDVTLGDVTYEGSFNFLLKSWRLLAQDKAGSRCTATQAACGRADILSPARSYKIVQQLSAVSVLGCRQLRVLANSANRLLCCGFPLTALSLERGIAVAGAFEMGLNALLEEIEEGDEGEAILSRRGIATLTQLWSMSSSVETEIERGEGRACTVCTDSPHLDTRYFMNSNA